MAGGMVRRRLGYAVVGEILGVWPWGPPAAHTPRGQRPLCPAGAEVFLPVEHRVEWAQVLKVQSPQKGWSVSVNQETCAYTLHHD